ncbi:hypothetical protein DXG01_010175 [Tephrocybe rancida]|nr:hypothetical protein DXG01_010175 [Tephrocybe rancida]
MDIPDFLSPVFSYLAETLPSPLYSAVIYALSHLLAVTYAFISVIRSFISRNPLEWDAQTILPPIMTLFAAYVALLSFYRTTTWMLRTSIFFVKWGTFFGILMAGAGWLLGNGRSVGRYGGIVSGFGDFFLDVMNGQEQKTAGSGSSRSGSRTRSSRTRESDKREPKPWDSYERHREYEAKREDDSSTDAQKVIGDILGSASKIVKESGWWSVLKGVVDGGISETDGGGTQQRSSQDSQAKAKAGRSRSR